MYHVLVNTCGYSNGKQCPVVLTIPGTLLETTLHFTECMQPIRVLYMDHYFIKQRNALQKEYRIYVVTKTCWSFIKVSVTTDNPFRLETPQTYACSLTYRLYIQLRTYETQTYTVRETGSQGIEHRVGLAASPHSLVSRFQHVSLSFRYSQTSTCTPVHWTLYFLSRQSVDRQTRVLRACIEEQ